MAGTKPEIWSVLALGWSLVSGCSDPAYPTVDRPTAGIFLDVERALPRDGVTLRPVPPQGIALTKTSEGFVPHLYHDAAGFCTIAYGHLVKHAACDGSEPAAWRDGVTEAEGSALLVEDMRTAQNAVLGAVEVGLSDGQYAALCDFVFNVGGGNFRRSTLLKVINRGDFAAVPAQLRRWVKAGGRTLPGLVTRREREIELFFDGIGVPRSAPGADLDTTPIEIHRGEG